MATSNHGLLGSLLNETPNTPPKRRCFISYHPADENEVQTFLDPYSNAEVFTHRALGLDMANEIVNSNDTDYVMRRIREPYMPNTSVAIVMAGQNTWKRRYVAWEIAASLRNGFASPANAFLRIKLPSCADGVQQYPDRLNDNLRPADHSDNAHCYARCIPYPSDTADIRTAMVKAYQRRETQRHLTTNARVRFGYNRT